MDSISKLYSDIDKIKKHVRASSGGHYDSDKVCSQIVNMFITNNRNCESLASSFADYWKTKYINASTNPAEEPSQDNITRLGAFQSLLECHTEDTEILTDEDWHELCSLVNAEAPDMDLNLLNDMMMIFVDKKAF